jgi:CheY-like chemotaxis protein
VSKSILFVDDEKPILRSLIRLFMQTEYNVFSADNGYYALEILKNNDIDLIVSDMRMPEMDGYELLQKVKERHPATVRLILSGYADENLVTKAIENNCANTYIFKPWDNDEIVTTISHAIDIRDIIKNHINSTITNELEGIVNKLVVFNKIQSQINVDNTNSLIMTIGENKDFENNVLNIINSSLADKNIHSLENAIKKLGLFNFKNICLINNLLEFICEKNIGVYKKANLRYICTVNLLINLIYTKLLNREVPEFYETLGLFHSLGEVWEMCCKENKAVKFDRNKIGAYFSNHLDLPYVFFEANLFNQDPMNERIINKEIIAVLHIAIKYARKLLYEEEIGDIDTQIFKYLNINEKECSNLITELSNRVF